MTTTQDRVRRAIYATAEQIAPDTLPPLRLPQAGVGPQRRASARRLPVWLAPVAAAAAVALIATAAVVISGAVASRPRPAGPGDTSVPPYYIAIAISSKHHNAAAIYATRTGALIAKVVPPESNQSVVGVSAAADDRTFVVAATEGAPGKYGQPRTRFYLVRFDPATRGVQVKLIPRLQVPRGTPFRSMSLSPSGTKLALNNYPGTPGKRFVTDQLKIMNLTTGVIRTWTSSAGEIATSNVSSDMSWAKNNTTIGFSWSGFTLHPERTLPTTGFWLLDTARPDSDLLADSHRVLVYKTRNFNYTLSGGYLATYPMLAADSETIVTMLTSKPSDTRGYVWFATFNAANGRLERVFDRMAMSKARRLAPNEYLLWTSRHADAFIVDPPPGHRGQNGIIRQPARLTLLPQPPGVSFPPAAW